MDSIAFSSGQPWLLVSVRSAAEARIALAGRADVIDVKEPSRGSLGAADRSAVAEVVALVRGRVPISVAGGELLEGADPPIVPGVAFAKLGLAGCGTASDWSERWRAAIQSWPKATWSVAVIYADGHLASSPPPNEALKQAAEFGCAAVLVDTWDKSTGGLFDHWSPREVAEFCERLRGAGLAVVLAGSLYGDALEVAIGCRPNLVAVRGAVCDGGRGGRITVERMAAVRAAVDAACGATSDIRLSPIAAE